MVTSLAPASDAKNSFPRLYQAKDGEDAEAKRESRNAALWTLKTVLIDALKLLHPYMPFITEEIFCTLQSYPFVHWLKPGSRHLFHLIAVHIHHDEPPLRPWAGRIRPRICNISIPRMCW